MSTLAADIDFLDGEIGYSPPWAAFAAAIAYDQLPPGPRVALLESCALLTPEKAIPMAQHLVGVAEDGKMGPATIQAIKAATPVQLIKSIYAYLNGPDHAPNDYTPSIGYALAQAGAPVPPPKEPTPNEAEPAPAPVTAPAPATAPEPTPAPALKSNVDQILAELESELVAAATARNPVLGWIVQTLLKIGVSLLQAKTGL